MLARTQTSASALESYQQFLLLRSLEGDKRCSSRVVASITSRCSGNEPALLPKRATNVLAESRTGVKHEEF